MVKWHLTHFCFLLVLYSKFKSTRADLDDLFDRDDFEDFFGDNHEEFFDNIGKLLGVVAGVIFAVIITCCVCCCLCPFCLCHRSKRGQILGGQGE